ncbi:MAG: hypothetical protein IJ437_02230 [Clostridia bacterium]|nr:hypothetical protein [Clostridia bacterium]
MVYVKILSVFIKVQYGTCRKNRKIGLIACYQGESSASIAEADIYLDMLKALIFCLETAF